MLSYLTGRPSRDAIVSGHQRLTRIWWSAARTRFDIYVSRVVLVEAAGGDPEAAGHRLALARRLSRLELTAECFRLARILQRESDLPDKASEDALHLSIAAVHRMSYLLTWNCRHIANAVLMPRFASIMASYGYAVPVICTPEQLLDGEP